MAACPLFPVVPTMASPFTDLQILQLAERHGTPFWAYDADTIRRRIGELKRFDTVRFAQKACSNTHLLRLIREQGAVVDAVSLGEVERALHAGFTVGYLGANVPTDDLVRMIINNPPAVLALSTTMSFHIGALREAVRRVRDARPGLPIGFRHGQRVSDRPRYTSMYRRQTGHRSGGPSLP